MRNLNYIWLNQKYPENIPYFETPAEALSAIATASGKNLSLYLKHRLLDDIVIEQYVEFVVTEEMVQANPRATAGTYTLKAERTYDDATSTWLVDENYIGLYYEENKAIIRKAFGARCAEEGTGRSSYLYCSIFGKVGARANASGGVSASNTYGEGCGVDADGKSRCNWQ